MSSIIKEATSERIEPVVELSVEAALRQPLEYQVSRSLIGWSLSADGNVSLLITKREALLVIGRMEEVQAHEAAVRRQQEEGV